MAKKYIDAEKLIAEIERRKEKWLAESRLIKKGKDKAMYAAGKSSAYTEFLSLVDSLQQEQPEVDLEKELDRYFRGEFKQTAGGNFNNYIQVARHFFALGRNARKEESK